MQTSSWILGTLYLAVGSCLAAGMVHGAPSLWQLQGSDFQGGAKSRFGTTFYHRSGVNYVYAQPTGEAAAMKATFHLDQVPAETPSLFLEAMDDDAPSRCRIRITLNGQDLLQGPSGFPGAQWFCRRLPIPPGVLRSGTNELHIRNLEAQGSLGRPPWFMVARCALAGDDFSLPPIEPPSLRVRLPQQARPIPEPLSPDHSKPGFQFRGTKGWGWTPEQYLEEIPCLAKLKMNFLMNCYLSMFTSKPGEPFKNEWWKPMTETRQQAYAKIISACREQGIHFCFAVHPQLGSPRPLDPASREDLDQFYQHYAWAQSQGVQWFSVSLDDVSWGGGGPAAGGAAHARLVNAVFGRLRAKDPQAQLIFCPVPYWGDGTLPDHRAYLESVARQMHPEVYVFWTGDSVVTPRITRKAAESYQRIVKHRLFLWDNYPVNDASPALHLGPVSGRDADLGDVLAGYMSNPLAAENDINRLPLATCADYAYNPWAYDPARSIGQAILLLARTDGQRQVLKDLIEAYPGFIVTGGGTGANPVRDKFGALVAVPESRAAAQDCIRQMEDLTARLDREFPDQFPACLKTLRNEVNWMKKQFDKKP
jgi:hypothetical protein